MFIIYLQGTYTYLKNTDEHKNAFISLKLLLLYVCISFAIVLLLVHRSIIFIFCFNVSFSY